MVAADYITVDAVIEEDASVLDNIFFFTKRRAESGTKGFATLRKGVYLFSNFIAGSPVDR